MLYIGKKFSLNDLISKRQFASDCSQFYRNDLQQLLQICQSKSSLTEIIVLNKRLLANVVSPWCKQDIEP